MCQEMLMFLKMTGPFWTSLPPCQIEMLINSGRYLSCSAFAPDMSKNRRALAVFRKMSGKNVRSASFAGQTRQNWRQVTLQKTACYCFCFCKNVWLFPKHVFFSTRNGAAQKSSKEDALSKNFTHFVAKENWRLIMQITRKISQFSTRKRRRSALRRPLMSYSINVSIRW